MKFVPRGYNLIPEFSLTFIKAVYILQTRDQKQPIEVQSKIKQDPVGPAMPFLTAMSQIKKLGKTQDKIQTRHTLPILILM
jgi:hypothetical protein